MESTRIAVYTLPSFQVPDSLLEGQIQAVRHHLITIVVVNIIIIITLPGVDDYCCLHPN